MKTRLFPDLSLVKLLVFMSARPFLPLEVTKDRGKWRYVGVVPTISNGFESDKGEWGTSQVVQIYARETLHKTLIFTTGLRQIGSVFCLCTCVPGTPPDT